MEIYLSTSHIDSCFDSMFRWFILRRKTNEKIMTMNVLVYRIRSIWNLIFHTFENIERVKHKPIHLNYAHLSKL